MTDNNVIKALECCQSDDCVKCPMTFITTNISHPCKQTVMRFALGLIKRQQAEIERLNGCVKSEDEVRAIANATIQAGIWIIKSEARKEFAERLKEKAWQGMWEIVAHVDIDDIDNLLGEMEKENNDDKA